MNQDIIDKIDKFVKEREWEQFHTGENLAKTLVLEATELLELYQWQTETDELDDLADELADVLICCAMIAKKYNFNTQEIIENKLIKNGQKYPVEKCKGTSKKYNKL